MDGGGDFLGVFCSVITDCGFPSNHPPSTHSLFSHHNMTAHFPILTPNHKWRSRNDRPDDHHGHKREMKKRNDVWMDSYLILSHDDYSLGTFKSFLMIWCVRKKNILLEDVTSGKDDPSSHMSIAWSSRVFSSSLSSLYSLYITQFLNREIFLMMIRFMYSSSLLLI